MKQGEEYDSKITRREMIKGASASIGIATAGMLGAATSASAKATPTEVARVTTELRFTEVPAPKITEYETDVLVVGAGFAGIPAAITVKEAGKSVLVVDKGHPGYSGCSPFPQCYQFFDAKYGDNAAIQIESTMKSGEYIANLDWYKVYLRESRECFDQLISWGILTKYPNASKTKINYFASAQDWEYHQEVAEFDRRAKWHDLLVKKNIPYVDHTMLMDVIEQGGRVVGAIGIHVPTGTVITFKANAIIMCMGIGSYKNSGFPVSGNTFDHEWIAYRHGIPVTGKEWDHLELTNSVTPSSGWRNYSWGYLENLHAVAGMSMLSGATVESNVKMKVGAINKTIEEAVGGIAKCKFEDSKPQFRSSSNSSDPSDPRRVGNDVDDMPVRNIPGACVGMGLFKNNGIFCGVDDLVGFTGLPGLYVAGDALASMMYGSTYSPGQGGSVPVSHIQGRRAAKGACSYIANVRHQAIDSGNIESLKKEILAPLKREKGINPRWACDVLHGVMAPWWVQINRNETTLNAALVQVEHLRDKVVPVLVARDPHDLRLCHEVMHKVLDAEMKLRSCLERKESRGSSYRSDYPYRDDKNFLCYVTLSKGVHGEMVVKRVPVKEEWKGDVSLPYEQRYIVRYPGEINALVKRGQR